jgi:hypothetical protein
MKFGAHMSTGGGVWKALERGRGINCEVVQFFVKNWYIDSRFCAVMNRIVFTG